MAFFSRSLFIIGVFCLLVISPLAYADDVADKKLNYDLQQKCSSSAKEFFEENKQGDGLEDYQCNYNTTFNKCFILISHLKVSKTDNEHSHLLADVLSRKQYASWVWVNNQGKKFYEVLPDCQLLDGPCDCNTYASCDSMFTNFVKKYMEN